MAKEMTDEMEELRTEYKKLYEEYHSAYLRNERLIKERDIAVEANRKLQKQIADMKKKYGLPDLNRQAVIS